MARRDGSVASMSDSPEPGADQADPEPEPLDVDGVSAVAVGTAVWAALIVVGLVLHDRLESSGRGWWLWVAVAGFLLGLAGLAFVVHRRNTYRSATSSPSG